MESVFCNDDIIDLILEDFNVRELSKLTTVASFWRDTVYRIFETRAKRVLGRFFFGESLAACWELLGERKSVVWDEAALDIVMPGGELTSELEIAAPSSLGEE